MNKIVRLHDKREIEAFFRRDTFRHLYAIGDLDDFFWPHTVWYGLRSAQAIQQIVLLYTEPDPPVLIANAEAPEEQMAELLQGLLPLLPTRIYAHLDTVSVRALADYYTMASHGAHLRMGLAEPEQLVRVDTSSTVALMETDQSEVEAFYADSYPGNWFVPRMLQTRFYFGARRVLPESPGEEPQTVPEEYKAGTGKAPGALVSVAGVHVYSQTAQVAALGNIATRPGWRGKGLAAQVTARLCDALLRAGIAHIGLNVALENAAAIACYERLGFRRVAEFGEYMLTRKSLS